VNVDQAIQEVMDQCEAMDGFLINLRGNRVLDSEQYQRLIDALLVYEQSILEADVINRRLAGCLFYLVEILGSMASSYAHHALEDAAKVKNAHAEIWELVERILAFPK
jgi:hypothetical protein